MNYASSLQQKVWALALPVAILLLSASVSADVVTEWNHITLDATKTAGLDTNLGSRVDAIEAIAVYDAVNSIKHFGTPYHYDAAAPNLASAEAAAAQAAHDVLLSFFPNQKGNLDACLSTSLAAISDIDAKANGIKVGAAAATDALKQRANDGSTPNDSYPATGITGVGQWRPTPNAFTPGVDLRWGAVKPFVLDAGNRFRPGVPPPVGSQEYIQAVAESREIGSAKSSTRTADQTHIAQFYKQDAELTANEAARALIQAHKGPVEKSAYVLALVDIAVADSRISVFDAKYTYKFWRPVTALNAGADGNVSNNYAAWTPLIETPAHPEYPSGHSETVAAVVEILKQFYGDSNALTLHTATPGESPRTLTSLSQLAEENGRSRIYGGIHYQFSNARAQSMGRDLAAYILQNGPQEAAKR